VRPIALTVILGTRPEVIKLAPVVRLARERPGAFQVRLVLTGQHRQLAVQLMDEFGLRADIEVDLMATGLELGRMAAECLRTLSAILSADRPDWVLVQGDTTSAFAGALSAFYEKIAVAHVEAGLRTGCRTSPFPEEMNRRLTTSLADLHLAPTPAARLNLLKQGVPDASIVVTGNTVIDALFDIRRRLASTPSRLPTMATPRFVLATVHRRENHGAALERICDGLLRLLEMNPSVSLLLPVHPNPRVEAVVVGKLRHHPRAVLCAPLGYARFVRALVDASLVLTDSGGVQEECAALGKPVLVLRADTEREEAVAAGVARLVGTSPRGIADAATLLLSDAAAYRRMARSTDAFGDGHAAARVLDALETGTRRQDLAGQPPSSTVA
jgi:UDP-N-acetylglucosamine 2-epimerase (non-hydrolysing)